MNRLSQLLASRLSLVHRGHRSYRFIPSKPVWRWHDDRSPCSDSAIFSIPPEEIPPCIELDDQTLKLLGRLSLVNFNEEATKTIVEEAIHFADCLLTPVVFRGCATRATVEPMISLLGEKGWEPVEVVAEDLTEGGKEESDPTAVTAAHILHHAAVTWENYFVAPPSNQPIHPELDGKAKSLDG
ncbi:expressed conserved protein [Echinococcus multilocularis]|uniref:Expressed conserved protein n=1 Tax=Echinococcus multilocularis TaxID=6211 RepID=A0A068Y6T3_ECHMU|nr:expressed conserved protein [Echinococcus multilocularis]